MAAWWHYLRVHVHPHDAKKHSMVLIETFKRHTVSQNGLTPWCLSEILTLLLPITELTLATQSHPIVISKRRDRHDWAIEIVSFYKIIDRALRSFQFVTNNLKFCFSTTGIFSVHMHRLGNATVWRRHASDTGNSNTTWKFGIVCTPKD